MFAGNFEPAGWMFCQGQILPISEYETLFNLIGTTYGGDGQSTFALPDLRGRLPLHFGNAFILAEMAGVENITLTVQQIPSHTHAIQASKRGAAFASPANHFLARTSSFDAYRLPNPSVGAMHAQSVNPTGGSQPHTNFQPYLCVNFIISLFGIFPSPT